MILALARRYSFSSVSRQRVRSLRTVLTVALSLAMVIVILSIMNFLQQDRFVSIRSVRSFDVVVNGDHKEEISSLFPSTSVFVYGEGEALVPGGAYLVRYIDEDYDGGLHYLYGEGKGLSIPYSLFSSNRFSDVTLSIMKKGKSGASTLKNVVYPIESVYYTELGQEFDSTMLFLPLSEAPLTAKIYTAVKGIEEGDLSLLSSYEYRTWKDMESSLYSAFLLEKTMMSAVLLLLFVIIAVSLRQSVRIFSESRRREMAELEILGLGKGRILLVSILSFLIVIALGIFLGLVLGGGLLPLLERVSSSHLFLNMTLTLHWGGFLFYSILMVLLTVLFVLLERRRDEGKELTEVIHEC
ncbi:MAG: hypothetical protein KBS81_03650 [Spirochaetales bacterium]|nr:hypothetical protein [Candidatus Physcosoma equi]